MKLTRQRQGDLYIGSAAVLWSLFPVITILSYNTVSPLISLSISTLFAVAFFAATLTIQKKWHEVKNVSAYKDILLATFFIGILYYVFFFIGLQSASAGSASIISFSEVFFSYLFFHIIRIEHIPGDHVFGAILMVIGALIVLSNSNYEF